MTSKIQHLIPGQLSSNIIQEYPMFVDFLKGYYEWMQQDGNPYSHIKNHLSYLNFEQSLEEYVNLLKNEFFHKLPEKVLADKSLLIKYSKQFFQSVGTEKSFQFIFKILFGESVEISYPRDMMLIPSNGKWIDDESLMYVSNSGNAESFLFKTITQTKEVFPGVFSTSSANVSRIIKRYAGKFSFIEMYLTNIVGDFDINYPIGADGVLEWILPISDSYNVSSSGINYIPDNILSYVGPATFEVSSLAETEGKANLKYQTLLTAQEITVRLNGSPLLDYDYDGKNVIHPDISLGDTVSVDFPVYPGFVVTDSLDSLGGIQTVKIIDMPFGITTSREFEGNEGGSGASVFLNPGTVRRIDGYYIVTDGFLSDKDKLQDSDYYQDFSYVIKTGIDISRYKDIVYDLLHPAGFKLIGEVSIIELINLMIKDWTLDIEFRPRDVFLVESSTNLYSKFGYIDDWKFMLGCAHYKVFHFADVELSDILLSPDNHFNFCDTKIDIITSGGYIDEGYFAPGYIGNTLFERDLCAVPNSDLSYVQGGYFQSGYV